MRRFILAVGAAALLVLASLAPVTANVLPTGPGESRCSSNGQGDAIGLGVAATAPQQGGIGPQIAAICNPLVNPS